MFGFAEKRCACIAVTKIAYAVGLYGDGARVQDGSRKELFEQFGGGVGDAY